MDLDIIRTTIASLGGNDHCVSKLNSGDDSLSICVLIARDIYVPDRNELPSLRLSVATDAFKKLLAKAITIGDFEPVRKRKCMLVAPFRLQLMDIN
jgi:hypothetical protein